MLDALAGRRPTEVHEAPLQKCYPSASPNADFIVAHVYRKTTGHTPLHTNANNVSILIL